MTLSDPSQGERVLFPKECSAEKLGPPYTYLPEKMFIPIKAVFNKKNYILEFINFYYLSLLFIRIRSSNFYSTRCSAYPNCKNSY